LYLKDLIYNKEKNSQTQFFLKIWLRGTRKPNFVTHTPSNPINSRTRKAW